MKIFLMPYEEKYHFSSKDLRYINEDPTLQPFYKYKPEIPSFTEVIQDKKIEFISDKRKLLKAVLIKQYSEMPEDDLAKMQVERLGNENTFTVTTAHQPCLMTGPLYVIYKAISTINLARKLNLNYPDFHFVPMFISGGEDHDLEETNHFHLFGKKIQWKTEQTGPVGRMETEGINEILQAIEQMSGNSPFSSQLNSLLNDAYKNASNYGAFFRNILAKLFHETGLLILNMDEKVLKKAAIPIFRDELIKHSSQIIVNQTQEELEKIGFGQQAYAREINLFYFHENKRLRIEREADNFAIVDSDIKFSEAEILSLLEKHPERFSPNVVIRPLYQEALLPNLAYVGGGGEISYWLERKRQFEHFNINFPVLLRRNTVFWLDHICSKSLNQLSLETIDIFDDLDQLINSFVLKEAEEEISLNEEKQQLAVIFKHIAEKANQLEASIYKTIKAEEAKHQKSIDHLEHKLLKAKKQQLEVSLNKLRKTHSKIFPNSKPQERFDNFIMYYLRLGPNFIEVLMEHLDPFSKEIILFQEED
ncbi:MAG: bacillithiol biosynthesis cysteine-adding enzyme BshC [Saprospirales bacterium]|nr:MAG: bacillithiol biosynthesis cysteine-adding enzyme BshC [Saprospirales bacterium]